MPLKDHSPSSPSHGRGRSVFLLTGVAVLLLLGVAAVMLGGLRPGDDRSNARPTQPGFNTRSTASLPTTTTLNTETEVANRLREIIKIREEAFQKRDASLFDDIYTSDCPCLEGARAAIQQLLKDDAVWRGRSTSIRIQRVSRITGRLWEVLAEFRSAPFRIEREDGRLIRSAPAERQRYRFLLVKPAGDDRWLLGRADLLEGG